MRLSKVLELVPYCGKNIIDQNVLKYAEHECSDLFYLNLLVSEGRFRMRAEAEVLTVSILDYL